MKKLSGDILVWACRNQRISPWPSSNPDHDRGIHPPGPLLALNYAGADNSRRGARPCWAMTWIATSRFTSRSWPPGCEFSFVCLPGSHPLRYEWVAAFARTGGVSTLICPRWQAAAHQHLSLARRPTVV